MIEKESKDYRGKCISEISVSSLTKILQQQNENIENISFVEMIQEAVLCIGQYEHANKNNRDIDVTIQEIHQETIEMVYKLPELLLNDEKQLLIKELRKKVIEYIKVLNAYHYECTYIYEILNNKLGLIAFEKKVFPKPDIEAFYKEIAAYLSQDIEKMPYKISELLSILPFPMTKQFLLDRAYAVLDEHSSRISTNEWEETIESLKEQFYGKACAGYGSSFLDIYNKIQGWVNIEYKKIHKDEMQSIAKDTHQIIQSIIRLRHTFQIYGRILNRIILLKELDFKDLHREIDKEITIQEIFKDFCYLVTKDDLEEIEKNMYLEQLYETCRVQKDQLTKDMQELGAYFNKVVEAEENLQNEEIQTFINKSQKIIAISEDLNTVDIDKVLKLQERALKSAHDPAVLQGFIAYIEDVLKEMSGEFRRVRMKRLFSLIPMPFKSPEEFFEYVEGSLEFNKGYAEKTLIINRIREQMKKDK